MKRFVWLALGLAAPLSSPLGCGGDGCLRNSDCSSDYVCRAGLCELENPPGENGGESGDDTTPTAGSSAGTQASGGRPGAGGSAGKASVAGSSMSDAGEPALVVGEGGEGGAGGNSTSAGGSSTNVGDAGLSFGGAL